MLDFLHNWLEDLIGHWPGEISFELFIIVKTLPGGAAPERGAGNIRSEGIQSYGDKNVFVRQEENPEFLTAPSKFLSIKLH